jgi:hypothetical protein
LTSSEEDGDHEAVHDRGGHMPSPPCGGGCPGGLQPSRRPNQRFSCPNAAMRPWSRAPTCHKRSATAARVELQRPLAESVGQDCGGVTPSISLASSSAQSALSPSASYSRKIYWARRPFQMPPCAVEGSMATSPRRKSSNSMPSSSLISQRPAGGVRIIASTCCGARSRATPSSTSSADVAKGDGIARSAASVS